MFFVRLALSLPADIAQHRQSPAGALDVFLSHGGQQFSIDFLPPRLLGFRRRLASLGKRDREFAAIVLVGGAVQVAARYQRVDQLAGRLLRDPPTP